jgi:GTP-binding protein HflX
LKVGWAGYGDREVVITDTVGFIRDLPKDLFAAFRATFEEAADADLLLHVVDASDDAKYEHMDTTNEVLAELELDTIPCIVVFNKCDQLAPFARKLLQKKHPDAVVLSAVERESTRPLLARVARELAERWDESAKTPRANAEDANGDANADADAASEERATHIDGSADEGTTLEELLRISGRRVKRRATAPEAPRTDKVR